VRLASLETAVGGALEETPHGPILVARRRFPREHRYGSVALGTALEAAPEILSLLSGKREQSPPPARLLYLDIETTGLAGGTGTYPFLVGVGFFEGESFVVQQYFLRDLDEEPALLSAIDALLPRFEGLVTYNGRTFDVSLLETRFVLARRRWPPVVWHLDLLPAARRLWAARLSDCRLATVEAHALGIRRENDLPGGLIPALYFEYLRRRHPGALPRLFAHNRYDLLSLVALTGWVSRALTEPDRIRLSGEEYLGLGRLWESWSRERGRECYRAALDRGLPAMLRENLLFRLADLAKRERRWEEACALWEAVIREAPTFRIRPWEELAKYHEHRSRDLSAAFGVVQQAMSRARATGAEPEALESLARRFARLTRRLGVSTLRDL
jgi:hypothetical protein